VKKDFIVEVCCGSIDDAIEAQKAGADRIELNSSLFLGGLTPSIGTIVETKKVLSIPVMVMIRPRSGGFCYTENEIKVMEYDTKLALDSGAEGIVFGILKDDGTIDERNCEKIMKIIDTKEAVFHRAFDVVKDPFEALDKLVSLGLNRVLTKGQQNTFEEGEELLRELIGYAKGRIEILPGGCRPYNVKRIVKELNCNQVHVASFTSKKDNSGASKPNIYFGGALRPVEDSYDIANYEYIKNMKDTISMLVRND
jgi:copper homeostasis protein